MKSFYLGGCREVEIVREDEASSQHSSVSRATRCIFGWDYVMEKYASITWHPGQNLAIPLVHDTT